MYQNQHSTESSYERKLVYQVSGGLRVDDEQVLVEICLLQIRISVGRLDSRLFTAKIQ